MASIALIDFVSDGHHPLYLRVFAETLSAAGQEVTIFCPNPELIGLNSPSPNIRCFAVSDPPLTHREAGLWDVRRIAIERLIFIRRCVHEFEQRRKFQFDLLFFAYLDQVIGQGLTRWDIDRFLGKPFTGLVFHLSHLRYAPRYAWARIGPLDPIEAMNSRLCCGVAVLDEGVAVKLSAKLHGKAVFIFPDIAPMEVFEPGDAIDDAVHLREISNGWPVLGLMGSLDKRKGLIDFIHLASEVKESPVFLLAAGKIAWHTFSVAEQKLIKDTEREPPANLKLINAWLPERTYHSLLRNCDIIFIAYRWFAGSSNLLTSAAQLRAPVLASDYGLIAERVRQYGIGMVVPAEDVPAMAGILKTGVLLEMSSKPEFLKGCECYSQLHSIDRLRTELTLLVDHCLSNRHGC